MSCRRWDAGCRYWAWKIRIYRVCFHLWLRSVHHFRRLVKAHGIALLCSFYVVPLLTFSCNSQHHVVWRSCSTAFQLSQHLCPCQCQRPFMALHPRRPKELSAMGCTLQSKPQKFRNVRLPNPRDSRKFQAVAPPLLGSDTSHSRDPPNDSD